MNLPNIIFVLCDDLGINDLHCYGREDHNTPNLDALAEQGARFTSSYACQAICSASRAGLLTGSNPARLHLTTFLPGRANKISQRVLHPEIMMNVPLDIKTFPRYFKEAGYKTGFIGKWHVGIEPGPKEHGFDHVYFKGNGRCTTPSETEGGKAEYELTDETIKNSLKLVITSHLLPILDITLRTSHTQQKTILLIKTKMPLNLYMRH